MGFSTTECGFKLDNRFSIFTRYLLNSGSEKSSHAYCEVGSSEKFYWILIFWLCVTCDNFTEVSSEIPLDDNPLSQRQDVGDNLSPRCEWHSFLQFIYSADICTIICLNPSLSEYSVAITIYVRFQATYR